MEEKSNKKKLSTTTKIFVLLLIGIIVGLVINLSGLKENAFVQTWLIDGLFNLFGQLFMRSIKMIVVPLVLFSIATGTSSISDIRKIGRMGTRAIMFYLATTAIAITFAIVIATIINPGIGVNIDNIQTKGVQVKEAMPLVQVIFSIVPTNPFKAFAEGNMLQIIFFAIFLGIVGSMLKTKFPDRMKLFNDFLEIGNDIMLEMVHIVMKVFAPIGVFGLVAKSFSELGFDIMFPLLKYMLGVTCALIIHVLITYPSILFVLSKLNPITFFKKWFPTMVVAFSTSSSNATLPFSLETAEEKLGVHKEICGFTLPLGATINMDGTSIMQGVATVFIAQLAGVSLGLGQFLTVILTATLASIGTAGVPGVGLIMLAMVLQSVGLPLEQIGLIMGIDRILDMLRTAVNITGDAVCTCIVAKSEDSMDLDVYNSACENALEKADYTL